MSVSPEKQLFKCFVCQAGGDLIKFTSDIEHINFSQAISKLAKRIGIEVQVNKQQGPRYSEQQQKFINIHKDAMDFFQYSLSTQEGAKALNYVKARGLNQVLLEQFSIGYAPSKGLKEYLISKGHDEADIINASLENSAGGDFFRDRLIFGIKNTFGDIVSFSARDLSGQAQAKYINSAETSLFAKNSILYNFSDAIDAIKKEKTVFINEGFMDVIAMYRAGKRNSVAIMGTALTKNHAKLLNRYKVVLMLDGDKAGISATIKSIKILLESGIETFVINNETGKDPDEILAESGAEALIEITNNKIEALEYIYSIHKMKYSNITPTTATEFIKSFGKYLSHQNEMTRNFYINKMANDLGLSKDNVITYIPSQQKQETYVPVENKAYEPKPEVIDQPKVKNNTFKLIKSMLQDNKLISIFKENKPYLIEPLLISITNYMVDARDRNITSKPSKEMAQKVSEINNYKEFVNTPEEFNELLKRVSIESYK